MGFPENLKRIREKKGLSQSELARRADLNHSTISKFESGGTSPNKRTIRILADVLGVSPSKLTDD